MELPCALWETIEQKAAQCPQKVLTEAAEAISLRYRKESGHGARLLTRDVEALAYACARMPATYGAVSTALGHTLTLLEPSSLRSVLDIGAGTGAASWAARALLPHATDFTCLEREEAMSRLGRELMEGDEILSQSRWLRQDLSTAPVALHADLVLESYCLNELSDSAREKTLLELWEAADRLLLLIEPGTPVGFSQLRKARELLLARGAHMAAPCPHEDACPLPPSDWCQFSCRIPRTRLQKALKGGDAPYEDEKFSFLALSKTPLDLPAARILRHPGKSGGLISLKLCTGEGLREISVTKKQGALFKQARKAQAGDSFPVDLLK